MIKPQLCKLLTKPFNSPDWRWERKYDGFRALVETSDGMGCIITARSGTDKTAHFPEIYPNTSSPALLDGEIVSATGLGFQEGIQPRVNRLEKQLDMSKALPACYMVFDILALGGLDVTGCQLQERRALLEDILIPTSNVQLAQQYTDGVALLERAKAEGWEGVVGKNLHQAYIPGKRLWIKVKCWQEGHFHVAGFTEGAGKRKPYFGALLLVDFDGNPVGEVGTGFTDAELAQWKAELDKLPWPKAEVVNGVYTTYLDSNHFIAVRIKYLEATNAGQLRFPVYLGRFK